MRQRHGRLQVHREELVDVLPRLITHVAVVADTRVVDEKIDLVVTLLFQEANDDIVAIALGEIDPAIVVLIEEPCIGSGLCERACIRYPQAIRIQPVPRPDLRKSREEVAT